MLLRCLVIDLISSTKSCIVDKAAGKWINQFRKAKKTATFSSICCSCLFTLGGTLQKYLIWYCLNIYTYCYYTLPCVIWTNRHTAIKKNPSKRCIFHSRYVLLLNHPFKPLVYCAPEHQSSTRRQSRCRYLKKSAAADGSPHNEDTNTGASLWVSYFIFHILFYS